MPVIPDFPSDILAVFWNFVYLVTHCVWDLLSTCGTRSIPVKEENSPRYEPDRHSQQFLRLGFFFFTPWKILAENKAWSRLRYGKKKKDYKIKKFNRPYKTMMDLLIVVIRLSGGGHAHIQLCRAVCVITGNRSHGSWHTTLVYSNVA